jgi:signal transduction histidine kinase/ActR/RegA family two-component response regulator
MRMNAARRLAHDLRQSIKDKSRQAHSERMTFHSISHVVGEGGMSRSSMDRRPTAELGRVLTAVAEGDLSQRMHASGSIASDGEMVLLGATVNRMVDQLSLFADEVTRVAREVGTEGRLGGQAQVPGVAGTWRNLTDSVNVMAANLTAQVRDVSHVATAVARGDLSQKIDVDAHGEILQLKSTINTMVDQLSQFAGEVTRVARDVGTEGRLGGQAQVPGVAGTWKNLTDNVNVMAANLTRQVRSIATAASALAEGENREEITVEARGEVAALADATAQLASQKRDVELASRELEERARQLYLASRYKSEFLANMSHELRTPLNSALILAKLLAENAEGNLTEQQVEFAQTIHSAGGELLQLINDILDLAKVEAGHMDLVSVPVTVEGLVTYIESLYRPLAADKNLDLAVTVSSDVPPSLETDRLRLQQILRNLLSNAIKFTHHGSVSLRIQTADTSETNSPALRAAPARIAFIVEDTGIGIPRDKLAHIFEAFGQADGTTSRTYGGTGLGLSISKELTSLLGGELQVHSQEGQGSSFTLFLPVGNAPAGDDSDTKVSTERVAGLFGLDEERHGQGIRDGAEAGAVPSSEPGQFHGETILIADDDPRFVNALMVALERHGLHVVPVDNGQAAIDALDEHDDIGLALIDVMMPSMDGNTAMTRIRTMPSHHDLPLIAVTANAMKGDREESLAAGATEYVTKPVDTNHLLRLIATHLPTRSRRQARDS